MAALSNAALTLMDWSKRLDPDGSTPIIAELLTQSNEILEDCLWKEGNLPVGHRSTLRTGLPSVAWRLLNSGTTPSKSTTAQVDFQCGMLEAWSEVDCDLAKLNGNVNDFRMSEAEAFIEAMNQEVAGTIIYGNSGTAPEEFTGFAPMYSSTSAGNGQNVLLAGGAGGDNMSILLIVWGNAIHGIFPKGSKAGLIHQDLGEQTVTTATGIGGGKMRAYQERFQWKAGLAIEDWRYAVRIANIDKSDLVANGGSAADLRSLMVKAIHRIPSLKRGKPVFYMNRTVREMLDIQRIDSVESGGGITFANVDGKPVETFRGIPIRIVDQMGIAETLIS